MNEIADHGVRFGRIAATIPVTDMDRALGFYIGALGFTKTFQNGNPVGFVILKRDAGELHLTLQPNYKAPKFNIAHLLVDDVDTLHDRCKENGARILKSLQNKDYGLRAFVFEDLDGNRLDVGQVM